MGLIHNKSLEFVLGNFQNSSSKYILGEEELKDSIINLSKSYLITNEGLSETEIDNVYGVIGVYTDTLNTFQLVKFS